MTDRVPSDHEDLPTHRVSIDRVGRTGRPEVRLPESLDLEADAVVRVVLDGEAGHGRIESDLEGRPVVRRVADSPSLARGDEGPNRLAEWVDAADVSVGGSAHLDVVTEGHKYGLRTPGNRVVYDATRAPDPALSDIARDLDG